MRLWRCNQGLLIERPARDGVPKSILTTSKRAWPDGLADYLLVNEQGDVVERHCVAVWSIDDELGASLFAVEGEALVEIVVREMSGDETTSSEKVLITGLQPANDAGGRALEAAALQRLDELAAQRHREGEARVAAIPGATDDRVAKEPFRAAQRALRERVAAYGETLSADLLGALVRFGQLYNAAPIIEPALDTFVAACRRAAFDTTLGDDALDAHELSGLPWWTAKDMDDAATLVTVLRHLESALAQEAEGQEIADALLNASAFSAAARGVARSRGMLEAMLAPAKS